MSKQLTEEEKKLLHEHIEQAKVLASRLSVNHQSIHVSQIGRVKDGDDIKVTAITLLMASSHLCEQIITALSESCLFLSLIGLRALVEYYINARYIFNHPEHNNDCDWIVKISKDFTERTFNRKAIKNRLNEADIKQRATQIGKEDLYNSTYASLCDYTHPTHHSTMLIRADIFKRNTFAVLQNALCCAHDVGDEICDGLKLKKDMELEKDIVAFRDSCIGYSEIKVENVT